MLRGKYQTDLNRLKAEEKHMRLIANHLEDQLNRLKVEELALKSQLHIEENPIILKEPQPEKSEEDVNINAVPLNLGVSYMNNNDGDDEEDEEEEDDDDDDNKAEVAHLSNFLDQLAHQQQQQEEEEEDEDD